MALAFLVHFVGDLHQPLHAGDKADQGGNDAKADYGIYAPARLNLHSHLGRPARRARDLDPAAAGEALSRRRARAGSAAGTVTDWSRESWAVRASPTRRDGRRPVRADAGAGALDDATIARLVPMARDEVIKGGLRLARLLDEALG